MQLPTEADGHNLISPLDRVEQLAALDELRGGGDPGAAALADLLDHLCVQTDSIVEQLARIMPLVDAGEKLAMQAAGNPLALLTMFAAG